MKTIRIKSLELVNFKGIKRLKLDDLGHEASIFGDNATGKTTVFDAFTWLLFGKDSTDRKDFEIKTLDRQNNVIPKIDHEVIGVLEVNGTTIELKRTFREKWVTKRGSSEAEFTGNETIYEWNGVLKTAGEYAEKISEIADESIFKMITSTTAFNALKWQDQRSVLIDLAGNITDEDVAGDNLDFNELLSKLTGKSFDEYKSQLKSSITKSKTELKTIPTRMDEVERGKPDEVDFEAIRKQVSSKEIEIETVENKLQDKAKAHQEELDRQKHIQTEIHTLDTDINATEHKLRQEARDKYIQLSSDKRTVENQIETIDGEISGTEKAIELRKSKIDSLKKEIHLVENKMADLRKNWEKRNAETFSMDENECLCPTCKREFDSELLADKRSEMEKMFNDDKRTDLERINTQGTNLKNDKSGLEFQLKTLETEMETGESDLKKNWSLRAELSDQLKGFDTPKPESAIYEELLKENEDFFTESKEKIAQLKEALSNRPEMDNTELKAELQKHRSELEELKAELQKETQINQANARMEQLASEEKVLAQNIASMEGELFTMERFEKAKSERIEGSVNSMFKYVDFKLFETQINGGEVPTCKALINGVPFSDANTASKINAGLDIINTLCSHYQVSAPIFIDNRESVVELIESGSQIINLVVSKADKKLRVETQKLESVA